MMRYSATAQPNIDVIGEENWHDAVRLTHALTPVAKELFANSCYFHGRKTQHSERQRIWNAIDPSRTGIPPQDYANWARKAYVFLAGDLPLEEQPLYGELTYEQWESNGYKGTRPDWVGHLGTLFPDLRLRKFLEVRMIDAQPFEHALAPMAFWATALHHARPQLWKLLKTNPSPAQLLQTVEQAARDEESIQILRRYATRKQHFPDDPKEFVRIEATTRPSLKL